MRERKSVVAGDVKPGHIFFARAEYALYSPENHGLMTKIKHISHAPVFVGNQLNMISMTQRVGSIDEHSA